MLKLVWAVADQRFVCIAAQMGGVQTGKAVLGKRSREDKNRLQVLFIVI